jgi:hypothetical protein
MDHFTVSLSQLNEVTVAAVISRQPSIARSLSGAEQAKEQQEDGIPTAKLACVSVPRQVCRV